MINGEVNEFFNKPWKLNPFWRLNIYEVIGGGDKQFAGDITLDELNGWGYWVDSKLYKEVAVKERCYRCECAYSCLDMGACKPDYKCRKTTCSSWYCKCKCEEVGDCQPQNYKCHKWWKWRFKCGRCPYTRPCPYGGVFPQGGV